MFKRSSTTPLLLFMAGMAAGWVAKQLYESPEVRERTKRVMANANELRQRLAESDEAERVKDIFGKVSREALEMYQEAKNNLIDELDALELSFDDLDKRKYLNIVSEIVAGLRADHELPENQVRKLTQALNSDWRKIAEDMSNSRTKRPHLSARSSEE